VSAARPASTEPTGAPSPFERLIATRSETRAVQVRGDAVLARGRADPLELVRRDDDAARAVVRVLDLDERRRRVDEVAARLQRREEVVGGEEAAVADLGELHAGVRRPRAGLVPDGVALP
jgi:hypothetical protein